MSQHDQSSFKNLPWEEQAGRLQALAVKALESYGISKDANLTLLKHRENAVFAVQEPNNGNKCALRVHRVGYQTAESINSELKWMQALREGDIQTPKPIAGVDGRFVQTVSVPEVPEACHCSVMSWVDGKPLTDDNPLESYRLLGQINARFHQHAKNWTIPDGFERQVWDEEGICGVKPLWGHFKDLAVLENEQLDLLYQAREVMLKRLEHYGKGPDRYGLIHADLMAENIILQNNTPCIIDFDDSGFGWFMYDLATLMTFNVADDNFDDILGAWIEGYRSQENLSDEDLAELPTFMVARCFVGLGWINTRKETPFAQQFTDDIVLLACMLAQKLIESQ